MQGLRRPGPPERASFLINAHLSKLAYNSSSAGSSFKRNVHLSCRTLLLLRLGCKRCGHHGSEHRKLTSVDNLIREEVEKAASNKCTHLIPVSEIPHSPVFGPHDPIPIPYESTTHNQVHDTGFKLPCITWGETLHLHTFKYLAWPAASAGRASARCAVCWRFKSCLSLVPRLSQRTWVQG